MTPVESATSSAVKTASDIAARAIIVLSETGETARLIAKFHPDSIVISVCPNSRISRQIEGFMCNTISVFTDVKRGDGAHVRLAFAVGKEKGIFADGDKVVAVHTMRSAWGQGMDHS